MHKTPLMPFWLWFTNQTTDGEHIETCYPALDADINTAIKTMTIHRSPDAAEWQLKLFVKQLGSVKVDDLFRLKIDAEPARVVRLGATNEINYANEAITKAIEIASIEHGHAHAHDWKVTVPRRASRTAIVEARSYAEAVAQVSTMIENDVSEFEASSESDMPEYDIDDITAAQFGVPASKTNTCDCCEDREHIKADETVAETLCGLPVVSVVTAFEEDARNALDDNSFQHDGYCPSCVGKLFE